MRKIFQIGIIHLMGVIFLSCSPAQAEGEKFAFIDVAKVFDDYQKTKDNDSVLQKEAEVKEEERNSLVQGIRQLKDETELLSDDAKLSKQAEIDKKVGALQEFDLEARKTLGEQRRGMIQEIFNDIDVVVQEYGKKNNLDFILNDRAVLYHRPDRNVTEVVLKELNKNYSKAKK